MGVMVKEEVKTKLRLQVLSPIHIGTGEELSPWDFALRISYMFVIRIEEVLEHLYNENKDKYEEALSKLEEGKGSIDQFLPDRIPEEWIVYKMELYPSIDIQKVKKVSTAIKNINVDSKPTLYIPASEIKGFIRTAIIYCYIKDNFNKFAGKFEKINPKFSFRKVVENSIWGEPSKDSMKYLKIEDVYGDFHSQIIGVKILLSSKFWIENVEAITGGVSKVFIIKVDNRVLDEQIGPYISEWKKCCYEFSNDLIEAEIKYWEDIKGGESSNLKKTLSIFRKKIKQKGRNTRLIDIVISRLDKLHTDKAVNLNANDIENLIQGLKSLQKLNTADAPIIRLGKYTGYLNHTISILLNGKIKKYTNPQPYNIAPIGNDIGAKNAKWFLFPLTRRLTLDNQTLGWCRLIPEGSINTQSGEDKKEGVNDIKPQVSDNWEEVFKKKGWRVKR